MPRKHWRRLIVASALLLLYPSLGLAHGDKEPLRSDKPLPQDFDFSKVPPEKKKQPKNPVSRDAQRSALAFVESTEPALRCASRLTGRGIARW